MIRKGRYKYIYYVGFSSELFDLESDPEEIHDLSDDPLYVDVVRDYEAILRAIVDPEEVDRRANAAQKELVEQAGGPEAVYAHLVTAKATRRCPMQSMQRCGGGRTRCWINGLSLSPMLGISSGRDAQDC